MWTEVPVSSDHLINILHNFFIKISTIWCYFHFRSQLIIMIRCNCVNTEKFHCIPAWHFIVCRIIFCMRLLVRQTVVIESPTTWLIIKIITRGMNTSLSSTSVFRIHDYNLLIRDKKFMWKDPWNFYALLLCW